MDTRALRSFVTVIELASFSRAADALGFTQSAVSQQIAALEHEVGAVLLQRRPVTTTPAGAMVALHAREILARVDAARADAVRLGRQDDEEPVRLGLSPAADETFPVVELTAAVQLAVALSTVLCERFNSGALDVVLVDGLAAPSDPLALPQLQGTTVRVLAESPLGVLLPADHPFARRAGLDLGALTDAVWLDAPASACPSASLAEVSRERLRLGTRYDGALRQTLHALVRAGRGVCCEPTGTPVGPGLVRIPLRTPRLTHRFELWSHESDRPAVLTVASAAQHRFTATAAGRTATA